MNSVYEYLYNRKLVDGEIYTLSIGRRYARYEMIGSFSSLDELSKLLASRAYPLYCHYFKIEKEGKIVMSRVSTQTFPINLEDILG